MTNRKPIRTRGKISFSKYFQDLKKGETVAVVKERSLQSSFPTSLQGRTGVVEGKRGNACIVKMKGIKKDKSYIIRPVHLKRINNMEKTNDKK